MADEWMSDNARNRAHAKSDQFATGSLQVLEITVGGKDLTVEANFDLFVKVVSTRSQPLILGKPSATNINIAFGHADVWPSATSFKELVDALQHADVGFTGVAITAKPF